MQIALPESTTAATLKLDPSERLTDDQYFDFCMANSELNVERTAKGEIVIVPPAGPESDHRAVGVGSYLYMWAINNNRGSSFGSSVQFFLPDGSALSPDAAWVSSERLAPFTKDQRRKFLPLVPEFIIEVLSPSDRRPKAHQKMRLWASNGVALGWLIDGDRQQIHIYRGTASPETLTAPQSITGEGPLETFTLPLTRIWSGL